jgi:hypothetical protein
VKWLFRGLAVFAAVAICFLSATSATGGELKGRVVGLMPLVGADGVVTQEGVPDVLIRVFDKDGNPIRKQDGTQLQTRSRDSKVAADQGKFSLTIPDDLIAAVNFRITLTFFRADRVFVRLEDVNGRENNTISVVQPELTDEPYRHAQYAPYSPCYWPAPLCCSPPARRGCRWR